MITNTTNDVVARLAALPTASISDALDSLGVHGTLHGIAPLTYDFRAAGPAFTMRYEPAGTARGSVGDFLDDVPPGAIVLIDNNGRTDVTVWGGIMTEIAADRGVAGTVINGVCRDVSTSLAQNYPLFRGLIIEGGVRDSDEMAAMDFPVFSSVTVVGTVKDYPGGSLLTRPNRRHRCPHR